MTERRGLIQLTNFPRTTGAALRAAAIAATDEFFTSVVLLLDFAGADEATDLTDLSNSGHVDTFVGNAQIDTAIRHAGENSLLLDGTGDRVDFPDHANWDLGDDWTIELAVYSPSWASNDFALVANDDSSAGWRLRRLGSVGKLDMGITAGTIKAETWSPSDSTWYHIAVCRAAGSIYMFVDGVQLGTPSVQASSLAGSAGALNIGSFRNTLQYFAGSIGLVRLTKGVGRYTTNFTPPSEFYPTSAPE